MSFSVDCNRNELNKHTTARHLAPLAGPLEYKRGFSFSTRFCASTLSSNQMKTRRMFYLSTIVVIALVGLFPWNKFGRAAYDSAEYKVVTSDGKFEVREYPDLMLVATSTKMDAQGRDGSFMKLFRYISDANESDKKISMTTPVFMENDKADSAVQMGFVMPKDIAAEGVPAPTGEGVDVRSHDLSSRDTGDGG